MIAALGKNHKIGISSLGRSINCEYSLHCKGEAVDVYTIDGTSTSGADANALTLLQEIVDGKLLPQGAGIGQSTCGRESMNNTLIAAGYDPHSDTCNHLHLALRSTPNKAKTW